MDKNLSFLFTPGGFRPDVSEGEENAVWMEDGGFPALYESGLKAAPEAMLANADKKSGRIMEDTDLGKLFGVL